MQPIMALKSLLLAAACITVTGKNEFEIFSRNIAGQCWGAPTKMAAHDRRGRRLDRRGERCEFRHVELELARRGDKEY
eukprot:753965-Hanusia_phi.AAC.6